MTWLIALALKAGVPDKYARFVVIALLTALAVAAFFGAKALYDRSVVDHHEAKQQQKAAKAIDQASTERSTDTIAIAKNEQEMHDAIQAQPDQPIAPTTRALSCERLRRIGRTPPACR